MEEGPHVSTRPCRFDWGALGVILFSGSLAVLLVAGLAWRFLRPSEEESFPPPLPKAKHKVSQSTGFTLEAAHKRKVLHSRPQLARPPVVPGLPPGLSKQEGERGEELWVPTQIVPPTHAPSPIELEKISRSSEP